MFRMGAAGDPHEVKHTLKIDLAQGLTAGYPESRYYIPRSYFQERVTRATIQRCLPGIRDELLDFASRSAPKIFAILLYSSCLPSLESALQKFKDRHFTDAELPLPRHTERCVCSENRAICRHDVARDVLNNLYGWEQFYTHQWIFLALEFETGVFDYVLDEQCILPIKLCDGHNEGSFGEVREGELNQDHARRSERVSQVVVGTSIIADQTTSRAANLVA